MPMIKYSDLSLIEMACRHAQKSMIENNMPTLAAEIKKLGERMNREYVAYCNNINTQSDCYRELEKAMGKPEYSQHTLHINFNR